MKIGNSFGDKSGDIALVDELSLAIVQDSVDIIVDICDKTKSLVVTRNSDNTSIRVLTILKSIIINKLLIDIGTLVNIGSSFKDLITFIFIIDDILQEISIDKKHLDVVGSDF